MTLSYAENSLFIDIDNLPAPTFLFSSPYRSFWATGIFARVTSPAASDSQQANSLQQEMKHAFNSAYAHGQAHPILVGAIPFDTKQPSHLFIPDSYYTPKRDQLLSLMLPSAANSGNLSDAVISQRSLPEEANFKKAVSLAVDAFRQQKLKKAVLSRLLDIEINAPINSRLLFSTILSQNPESYHFYLPLEKDEILLGASPELLLRKHYTRFYSTPLAGSAKRSLDPEQDRMAGETLLNSQKDHNEHRFVVEEIQRILTPHSQKLFIPEKPTLLKTATLWHLASEIHGECNVNLHALQLATMLHPTPALCGYPTAEAHHLIKQLEPFDRGLFSGIVGWCDAEGNGEWVVVIRSCLVQQQRIRLFAGAGIVIDSQPQSEWDETQTKLNTLLRAFGLA